MLLHNPFKTQSKCRISNREYELSALKATNHYCRLIVSTLLNKLQLFCVAPSTVAVGGSKSI